MAALSSELRSALEKAVVAARDDAEAASRVALGVLGVDEERVPEHLCEGDRRLRAALGAEARQLGGFDRLVEECAYEQWHRMLFARFLAENDLLMHPHYEVAITLAECEEIAAARGVGDLWLIAAEFAAVMLPGIFRPDDPVLQLQLAPEGQGILDELVAGLAREVFTSDDGLGWVYQYWQTKKKREVNDSGRMIGGSDIAPVTQLFTEHYMVRFLLENTLGAWWTARCPDSPLVKDFDYLRFNDRGKPAVGNFPGWPASVDQVTVMDPCCGSGHFLVTAFEMLRRMRMEEEGLSARDSGDAVLRDNLFGLELDARCTQISAFALALTAWKSGGYRELPLPNVACSGISAAGRLEDWKELAHGDERIVQALERLHSLFVDAADLGSLIDPRRETGGDLLTARFDEVAPLLGQALKSETNADPSAAVFGNAAVGAARAAALLGRRYTLVATNPPFLGRGKQGDALRKHLERRFYPARQDIATAFLQRFESFTEPASHYASVAPENWLVQASYAELRRSFLLSQSLSICAILGEEAFESFGIRGPRAILVVVGNTPPADGYVNRFIDASTSPGRAQILIPEKVKRLKNDPLAIVRQSAHLDRPSARILTLEEQSGRRLSEFAISSQGLKTGDDNRRRLFFWERGTLGDWKLAQGGPLVDGEPGLHYVIDLAPGVDLARMQGMAAWGRRGISVLLTRHMSVAPYIGVPFFSEISAVTPIEDRHLQALTQFAASGELQRRVREIDRGTIVSNSTILDVLFDPETSATRSGNGIDVQTVHPTQWLFAGHPRHSDSPLQVAVARLIGYRWPRQLGSQLPEYPTVGEDELEPFADEDGIVCLVSVRGERPASERLRALLASAFAEDWSPGREADLLAEQSFAGKSLEQWLRDGFFEQHCQLFHQRPFAWQVWDGRKDGFSALVNYHRLGRASLERLAYTYLGDWTRKQQNDVEAGVPGADLLLVAARDLQRRLQLILDGEPPYDAFVRWKPLEEQPIGWEPDLDDGVRLNIRPFVEADVLRKNPRMNWNKDRGKEPESLRPIKLFPWFWKDGKFAGERVNDCHYTIAEKRRARELAAGVPHS